MTLSLDFRQRLNLVAVLGETDAKGRELHAVWHLQDALELDPAEKEAVEFREQSLDGQQYRYWNDAKSMTLRSFDLAEADLACLRKAIEEFPRFKPSRDRIWLAPVKAQLANGQPKTEAAIV